MLLVLHQWYSAFVNLLCFCSTAKSKAPKFEQALQPLEIDEGDSGEIKGKVHPNEDGSLPLVSWLKDGKPLEADDQAKPFALPDGTIGLQFSDAKPSDAANYTAVLKNPGTDEEDQSSAPVHVSRKFSSAALEASAGFFVLELRESNAWTVLVEKVLR